MTNEMRDWPMSLRINAAAARLAAAVYYAKAEAFGGESLHWDALDIETRHRYTERAAELIRTFQPITVTTGLRSVTNKIIGVIQPEHGGAA